MNNGLWGGLIGGGLGQYSAPQYQQQQCMSFEKEWLAQWGDLMQAASLGYSKMAAVVGAPLIRFKFHRVNTLVYENEEPEPLDWLRMKVAKWLERRA